MDCGMIMLGCVCVQPFKLLNQVIYIYEVWYERYTPRPT